MVPQHRAFKLKNECLFRERIGCLYKKSALANVVGIGINKTVRSLYEKERVFLILAPPLKIIQRP
jgi:hypothetical protein